MCTPTSDLEAMGDLLLNPRHYLHPFISLS